MPPDAPSADRPLLGMALRVVSATSFAGMAMLLKLASGRGAGPLEMVFYRSAGALPLVLAWAAFGSGIGTLRTQRPMAHLTRCVIGTSTMLFTFGALSLLPIGEATTITYTAPIFATILSAVMLREAIGGRRWTAVAAGFAGMVLVAQPGESGDLSSLGIGFALAAAVGQSAVMITLRQIGKTETTQSIVFWFTSFGVCLGAALLPFFGRIHDPATFALLLGGGLVGGLGQILMTASLRYAPVSVVVPFDYLQIIWATLIGWLVFATPPGVATLAGAALIAASGIYTAYRERRKGQDPTQGFAPPEG